MSAAKNRPHMSIAINAAEDIAWQSVKRAGKRKQSVRASYHVAMIGRVTHHGSTVYIFRSQRGCLSYILANNKNREAIVIDPSVEAGDEYVHRLAAEKLSLRYIVDTHTHADHISAFRDLKKMGVKYVMHGSSPSSQVDVRVRDGDVLKIGDVEVCCIHTPGHAPDSILLLIPGVVFTADTLLIGGTGRTDLRKDSNSDELYESIWQKIVPLGDDMIVYPGHDYKGRFSTTIGEEKNTNPRLKLSRDEFVRLLDAHHPPLPELFEESVLRNSE